MEASRNNGNNWRCGRARGGDRGVLTGGSSDCRDARLAPTRPLQLHGCVKATAVDGRLEGFEVTVVQEGIRGVDEHPGDSVEALREMDRAGVATAGTFISSSML